MASAPLGALFVAPRLPEGGIRSILAASLRQKTLESTLSGVLADARRTVGELEEILKDGPFLAGRGVFARGGRKGNLKECDNG
jgi:hypothetical protein